MDKKHISLQISCPKHVSERIQRVNIDPNASQHLFCLECILQQTSENPLLASTLKTIPDFIDMAAQFYSYHKDNATPSSDVPDQYTSLLSRQSETLESLSRHIASEKEKIESEFDILTTDVLQVLTDKKNEYLQLLDQQVVNLKSLFTSFEEQIKKAYPSHEDIPNVYPSRDELVNRVQNLTDDAQLVTFVKNINKAIRTYSLASQGNRLSLNEIRREELAEISTKFSDTEHNKPVFDMEKYNYNELKEEIKTKLNEILEKKFVLENSLSDDLESLNNESSKLIDRSQFGLIREWLGH